MKKKILYSILSIVILIFLIIIIFYKILIINIPKKCFNNDYKSCYVLGMQFYNKKDYTTSAKWVRKAADNNIPEAQNLMGYFYQNGIGVNKDLKQAFNWYLKAANNNDITAQYNLGILYISGQGVDIDEIKGLKWLKIAKNRDFINAKEYFVQIDNNINNLTQLANKGNADAQIDLARLYYKGSFVKRDIFQVINWLKKAADLGRADAQFFLGKLYQEGQDVNKNLDLAIKYLTLSANQGFSDAQYELAKIYANEESIKDYTKSFNLYSKASEQNNLAKYELANLYLKGLGVEKNYKNALNLYKYLAEDKSESNSQFMLGYFYEQGLGVEKDAQKALKWYKLSADNGNVQAKEKYENLIK